MSRKSKGINAERELIHLFWSKGWPSVRIAGSGSMKYPSPDILATNKIRKLAIECKTTKYDNRYIAKEDVNQLKNFSTIFGAEPWFAVKFNREGWYFINPDDLKKSGKLYVINILTAKKIGLLFEELIGNADS